MAVIAGAVALDQRNQARDQADARPRPSGWAPRRWSSGDLDRALLLARQGVALDDSAQTRGNLLATLLKSPAAIGVLGIAGVRLSGIDARPERTHAGGVGPRRPAAASFDARDPASRSGLHS